MGRGRGRSLDERARPLSGRGPAPFTRGQGQSQDRPVGVPFSRGHGQDRSGSAPRGRSFQQGHVSAASLRVEPPPPPPAGLGGVAPPHRTSSRASLRTPERSQRSGGRDRDGSRDSRKDSLRERSRDTVQRQHSSSSRPSRTASGATGHSPMRSSGVQHSRHCKVSSSLVHWADSALHIELVLSLLSIVAAVACVLSNTSPSRSVQGAICLATAQTVEQEGWWGRRGAYLCALDTLLQM